jgi:hypothetical protein
MPAVLHRGPEADFIIYRTMLIVRIPWLPRDGSQRTKNKNLNPLFPCFSTPSGIHNKNMQR